MNKVFPLKKFKLGYKTKLPWLTPGMKASIITKNKLYAIYRKTWSTDAHNKYKTSRNSLNHILRLSKRKYYQNALLENHNNLKQLWQLIREIINKKKIETKKPAHFTINGNLTEDSTQIANHFNTFFYKYRTYTWPQNS